MASANDAVLTRSHAWLIAVVATLAMTVSYVDRQVLSSVAASVRKDLAIDETLFGVLAGAFSLSYLVIAPLAGAAIDRIGARRGLPGAILLWSAVSAAHALAPSFAGLLALRIALGAAEAPSFPAAAQSVKRALPAGDRSAAFGLIFTGSSLGAAIGGPLAITLDVAYGWRTAFFIASTVGLAWLPAWLWVTRSPVARDALARATDAPVRPASPPSRLALIAQPAVLRAMLLVLGSAPGLMFVWVWLPQYLELGRGLPKSTLPHFVWLPPVMADVGMVTFGVLASRMDRRARAGHASSYWPLVLVCALLETTLVLVPLAPGAWAAVWLIGLSAAGGGGLYTLLTSDMMARVAPAQAAMAGGFTAAAQSLTYVVLNPIVGRAIHVTHSYDSAMILLGAPALPAALAWTLWSLRGRAAVGPQRA